MKEGLKEQIRSAWRKPEDSIKAIKNESGKKAIGLVLTDVPPELVHAAGAIPVTLLGKEVAFNLADKHMQGFACSYSRGVVELAEGGELDFIDGVIIPYACDTTRCMDLIFKFMDSIEYYDCLRIPRRVNADGVEKYYLKELERLAASLSKYTGVQITDEILSNSVKLYNQVRSALQKARDALRQGKDGITPSEYFDLVRAAMVLPPEKSLEMLSQAVDGIGQAKANGGPRVVVAGKIPEPAELIGIIEKSDVSIIEDHLVIGGRWVERSVAEDENPWTALVKRQLCSLPFSGIWDENDNRASYLIRRVEELKADGAIFLVQKFCEIAEIDYPGIKEELDKKGIPMLVIETDFRVASLEPVKTRVEAFAEMLKENAAAGG